MNSNITFNMENYGIYLAVNFQKKTPADISTDVFFYILFS